MPIKKFQLRNCKGITKKGLPCKAQADASGYCRVHNNTPYFYQNASDVNCTICGKKLFGIKNAKKLRKIGRCGEHINTPLKNATNKWAKYKNLSGKKSADAYYRYIQSFEWKSKAKECKKRYGNRCAICFSDKDLRTHHRTYKRLFVEKPEDLICLCKECHMKFHDVMSYKEYR